MGRVTFGRRYGDSVWLIILEHDTNNPFKSDGSIIMEQYTKLAPEEVQERAQSLADAGAHGRVWMVSFNEKDCVEVKPAKEVELIRRSE